LPFSTAPELRGSQLKQACRLEAQAIIINIEGSEVKIILSKKSVADLKKWFTSYVQTFKYKDLELQQNIDLKKDHTRRVCEEIINLGEQLGLNEDELRLAEIIALLHDIGRFEQYARYKTFWTENPKIMLNWVYKYWRSTGYSSNSMPQQEM